MFVASEAESDLSGIFSFRSLYEAFRACGRRKRNTINALEFEIQLLENLVSLCDSLRSGTYQPTRSVCFVVKDPKFREVFAADFRDRVVHHWLVPRLEKRFEPKFIFDSYSCRKDKGTHAAVKRLQCFMRRITMGGKNEAWFLQLDIRSFFMSVDRKKLITILEKQVKDKLLTDLASVIINHDCTNDYVYKGDPLLIKRVPDHKSLFHIDRDKGLPIGNLTSQFFANVYLNELDQFVKHTLGVGHYIRYMDDFVLIHQDRKELMKYKQEIESFLSRHLELSLNDKFVLKSVYQGADFLGYIVRPDYMLVRNRVAGNFKSRLEKFRNDLIESGSTNGNSFVRLRLFTETVTKLRQTISSYLGHFKHANSFHLQQSVWQRFGFIGRLFYLDKYGKLMSQLEPPFVPINLKSQYNWFFRRFPGVCVFFQVGRYIELFGKHATENANCLGLKIRQGKRGLGEQSGFPVKLLRQYKRKALERGISYIVVGEVGYYRKTLKKRAVTEILEVKTG